MDERIYCGIETLYLKGKAGISISIIYLPSGTRGVVAQSPEPGAHDKSD